MRGPGWPGSADPTSKDSGRQRNNVARCTEQVSRCACHKQRRELEDEVEHVARRRESCLSRSRCLYSSHDEAPLVCG
jgi:hypothetical protein